MKIDGSKKLGSGTILRHSVSLATISYEDIEIKNIRANRSRSGLKPQHLTAVRACSELSGGDLQGDEESSKHLKYSPGSYVKGGDYHFDIGTAGSTTMLALTVLPLQISARDRTKITITGGTFQDYAPSPYHTKTLVNILNKLGLSAELKVEKYGYYPKGGGKITLDVEPLDRELNYLNLTGDFDINKVRGVAVASNLQENNVAERMKKSCKNKLEKSGYKTNIKIIQDNEADGRGAGLVIWSLGNNYSFCMDGAGKKGRPSEKIGEYVADKFMKDAYSYGNVDRFLADQLVIYGILTDKKMVYDVPKMTDHLETNLWIARKFVGDSDLIKYDDNRVTLNSSIF